MPTLSFIPSGKTLNVAAGANLLVAVREAGFAVPSSCGSRGLCGKCRVKVVAGDVPDDAAQRRCLTPSMLADGWRAACVSHVENDLTLADPAVDLSDGAVLTDFLAREPRGVFSFRDALVFVEPPSSSDQTDDLTRFVSALSRSEGTDPAACVPPLGELRSLPELFRRDGFQCRAALLDDRVAALSPASESAARLGLAVDIGTTTVAAALCDLADGRVLAIASAANPQSLYGDDVISRSEYAMRGEKEALELRSLIMNAVASLAKRAMTDASMRQGPLAIVIAANTIMNHLLLGFSPGGMAVSPFIPVFRAIPPLRGRDFGWPLPGHEPIVHILPNVAAYVGGDIVAGLLAHDVGENGESVLYLDIGTNGEMALAVGGELYSCATAAGPAFEGARIGQGMRAVPGAIAAVGLDAGGDIEVGVVDGGAAKGICGTGLLDAVATLFCCGLVDAGGRLLDPDEALEETPDLSPPLLARLHLAEKGGGMAFWLVKPGEAGSAGVALTQQDIREFQLAKGAVAAGVVVLLATAGIEPENIGSVLLAGGFGNYLDPASALAVGLVPPGIALEKIRSVGNAALAGARLCLLSRDERTAAVELSRRVRYIELSGRSDFQIAFAEAMLFPET